MQRKGALPGKIFARCILRRRFAGHFGRMARISCQSQPVFGCMARESCRELAVFPPEAAFGMRGAKKLPRIAARERIRAQSCHRQAPGNAFHGHFAISERPQRRSARHHAPRHHAPRHHAPRHHNAMRCNIATPCATMPCTVRGAFVAAEKVSCGLRVSMR